MAKSKDQSGKEAALDPALPQKKRARRRLVGAAALCLAAAVALPLVLDSEPRKPVEDIKVQIPSRDTPMSNPAGAAEAPRPGAESLSTTEPKPPAKADAKTDQKSHPKIEPSRSDPKPDAKADAKTDRKAETKTERKADAKTERKVEPKAEAKPEPKAERKTESKAESKSDPKTDSKSDPKAATKTAEKKYLLQIGAYANERGASDQLAKVRTAGLVAFTEKVRTAQGERIRVRVGPFASREAAEQARGQLKLSGIDSALIAP